MFRRKEKIQEALPEGRATAEILVREAKTMWGTQFYEFYAQVVSSRGFEDRYVRKFERIPGHEKVVYSDVIEDDSNFKRHYYLELRKELQNKVLNPIIADLVAEGFTPTHARGGNWFSIRFERN